jgi:hypothetical protein
MVLIIFLACSCLYLLPPSYHNIVTSSPRGSLIVMSANLETTNVDSLGGEVHESCPLYKGGGGRGSVKIIPDDKEPYFSPKLNYMNSQFYRLMQ